MKNEIVKNSTKVLLLLMGLSTHAAFAQSYSAFDIDPTHATVAYALNDSGWIGGYTEMRPSDGSRADVYAGLPSYSNLYLGIVAQINYAGAPHTGISPHRHSQINALNKGALGVGFVGDDSGSEQHAAMFTYDGRWADLGVDRLLNTDTSSANAVSDSGWVVGTAFSELESMPFVWIPNPADITRGTVIKLRCGEGRSGTASAVNRDGLIGGSCGDSPYLWWNGIGYDISSWVPRSVIANTGRAVASVDTASIGHFKCEVTAIANSYAFVVGCSGDTAGMFFSFVSTPSVPALTQVVLDSDASPAIIYAINDQGCAVGRSFPRTGPAAAAIKYCNGMATNLDSIVPGVNLTVAYGINSFGDIIVGGHSSMGPETSSYLLIPAIP